MIAQHYETVQMRPLAPSFFVAHAPVSVISSITVVPSIIPPIIATVVTPTVVATTVVATALAPTALVHVATTVPAETIAPQEVTAELSACIA